MAKLLGTSWVSQQGGGREHSVAVSRFADGVMALPSVHAIRVVFSQLSLHVEQAGLEPFTLGKIISNAAQSEAGLFVDRSLTEGACIALRCERMAARVTIVVGPSSRALRSLVWAMLGVGIVAGLAVSKYALPTDWAPKLLFALGLLIGVAFALLGMLLLRNVTWLAGGCSEEIAEQLNHCVENWIATLQDEPISTRAKKSVKKKKKKRRRKSADAAKQRRIDSA